MTGASLSFRRGLSRYSHVNWALADQAMVSGTNFLTGILFARYLGLDEYGRFTLVWMAVLFCNSFQQAGIIAPMMTLGPKQTAEDEPVYYGSVVAQQIAWALLCFFLICGGAWICGAVVPQWGVRELGIPLAVTVFAWQLQDFLRRYFFVRGQGKLAFLNDTISYLGQLSLLLALFNISNLDSASVLWLIAVSSAVAVIVGVLQIGPLSFSWSGIFAVAAKHWRHSRWLLASALIQWTSGNFFIISLGAIVGPSSVGALRVAQNLMGVTHILFQGLENIVPTGAARSLQTGGVEALKGYLQRVTLLCGGATALFCLIVAIAPSVFLGMLYGSEYMEYGYLLWWYVPIYLLISAGLPLRSGLRALDNTRPIFVAYTMMTCFAIFSASPLVNGYGISGAMIGTLGTQLILQSYMAYRFHSRCSISSSGWRR